MKHMEIFPLEMRRFVTCQNRAKTEQTDWQLWKLGWSGSNVRGQTWLRTRSGTQEASNGSSARPDYPALFDPMLAPTSWHDSLRAGFLGSLYLGFFTYKAGGRQDCLGSMSLNLVLWKYLITGEHENKQLFPWPPSQTSLLLGGVLREF